MMTRCAIISLRLQVIQGGIGEPPLPEPDLALEATHQGACSAGAEGRFGMVDLPKAAAEVPDGAEEAFPEGTMGTAWQSGRVTGWR
ncbi:hypothetical protein TSH64_06710 [Azospirillum sp. TSH64]|nr:hypothetical protein TSH64_06710 [Azospirillum sp. TSH64]